MSAQSKPINPVEQRARAARLGVNERLMDQQLDAMEASMALIAQGFTVLRIDVGGHPQPWVHLHFDQRLAQMVRENAAAYNGSGLEKNGEKYRAGSFQICNCQIVWKEVLQ